MPYIDPEKRRVYQKQWNRAYYLKHRAAEIARGTKRKNALREWLDTYRSSLSCENCGENDPVCLDFHHKDASEKDFSIGDAKRIGWSKETILLEIQKCMVVCANCHRKIHANLHKAGK